MEGGSVLVSRRLIVTVVVVWGFACLAGGSAYGQRGMASTRNRASSWSASQQLGLVGGLNTGRYGDASSLTNVSPTSVGSTGRGLSQPNYLGGGWTMGRLPAPAMPQAFLSARTGVNMPATVSPWATALSGPQTRDVERASQLQASFSLGVSLSGIGATEISLPDSPVLAPPPARTAFHAFYGLKAVEARPVSDLPIPDDGWAGLLRLENERACEENWERARELFKAATPEDAGDDPRQYFERLSKAEAALRLVRDLDREAYVPCLLLIHVALEKDELLLASSHLRDAVRRHPAVFVERPDLAAYYGDPELLEATARGSLRLGDDHPATETYALQAYCAWLLDDRARLRSALDRLTDSDLEGHGFADLSAVRTALMAAANR